MKWSEKERNQRKLMRLAAKERTSRNTKRNSFLFDGGSQDGLVVLFLSGLGAAAAATLREERANNNTTHPQIKESEVKSNKAKGKSKTIDGINGINWCDCRCLSCV